LKWRVKRKTNDELRQRFINLTVPQAQAVNLTFPDADMKFNDATENWEHGEVDWEEFNQVIRGNGPCNAERLAARNKAHDEGAWVRAAATAYAEKHAARDRAESAA
ncbi:MAG: phenylacetate-CoA oxygenase, PaaG subunit, partial [Gemmatimonadetes bacterium]|nr:phenylacetate-CoA oxygenase, PaaG subunit [Gemmatimonadota bacterium]